jgi:AcrR family transcriptional regulator
VSSCYSPVVTTGAGTLAEAKRDATNEHILSAARHWVLANGLDATMEQLAIAAGVSRRTLFRLFGTREQLLASAFAAGMAEYQHELPHYEGDRDDWLRATCDAAHRMNMPTGPGFWELTSRPDLPPDLAATERERRRRIRETMAAIASLLWRSSNCSGDPPEELVATVGAHLSPHFTAAVEVDLGQSWQVASALAYDSIMHVLQRLTVTTPATSEAELSTHIGSIAAHRE